MTLELPLPIDLMRFAALSARVSGFLILAPVTGSSVIPIRWRLLLGVAVSLVVASVLPADWQVPRPSGSVGMPYLIVLLSSELLVGLLVSLFVHIMFEIFSFAGHVAGVNMGFEFAEQIDPTLDTQHSILSVFMTQIFTIVFVAGGGIDALLRLAVDSVHQLPPGAFAPSALGMAPMIKAASQIFATGLQLALPIFCATMFMNVALGLMTRFGEEFQVLMLAFPIRIAVGFFIIFLTVPLWVVLAGRTVSHIGRSLSVLIFG